MGRATKYQSPTANQHLSGQSDNGWGRRSHQSGGTSHQSASTSTASWQGATLTAHNTGVPPDPRLSTPAVHPIASRNEALLARVPDKERRLAFLLRTAQEQLYQDLAMHNWTGQHSELLLRLIRDYQETGSDCTLKSQTMHTSLASFLILTRCHLEGRVDDQAQASFEMLRERVQNVIFDCCEDPRRHVREEGYQALLLLSTSDLTSIKSNCWALLQLLQNNGDGEALVVQDILASHIKLSLSDCLDVLVNDGCFGPLRGLALDFLSSDRGRNSWATIIDNGPLEIDLARRLAPVLLVANRAEMLQLRDLLFVLRKVWPEANTAAQPQAERQAARDVGAALLWNLCRSLMVQAETYVFTEPSVDNAASASCILPDITTDRLVAAAPMCSAPVIFDGYALFDNLMQILLGSDVPEYELGTELRVSKAKRFIDRLEASTQYLHCFLPVIEPYGGGGKAQTALHHFTPVQRIVFFRSAANLATRVFSAAQQCPQELSFPGEKLLYDIATVTLQALLNYLPLDTGTARDNQKGGGADEIAAQDAYVILAAEALLTTIHQCESYRCSKGSNSNVISCNREARDQVRVLMRLARSLERRLEAPKEVSEAAIIVLNLGWEYLKAQPRTDPNYAKPKWLIEPPPFPVREGPNVQIPTGPRRRQSNNSEEGCRKARQAQDRGIISASKVGAGWDTEKGHGRRSASPTSIGQSIAIRGTSQVNFRPADVYRPRTAQGRRPDRSKGRNGDKPKGEGEIFCDKIAQELDALGRR